MSEGHSCDCTCHLPDGTGFWRFGHAQDRHCSLCNGPPSVKDADVRMDLHERVYNWCSDCSRYHGRVKCLPGCEHRSPDAV